MLGPETGCTLKNKSKSTPLRRNKALVGSLGFEPRLPTPQAGILDQKPIVSTKLPIFSGFLDQARLRPQQPTKYEAQIINTLIKLKNAGRNDSTIRTTSYNLRQLSRNADLNDPEQVKAYIANTNLNNATKIKLCKAYNYFCKTNGIQWEQPKYKTERKIPLIPTTENINKIISASN
jgi:hypothetical protein